MAFIKNIKGIDMSYVIHRPKHPHHMAYTCPYGAYFSPENQQNASHQQHLFFSVVFIFK